MRVFVTGATGYIGSAVVPELLKAGHEVVGLARSDESAAALEAAGAESQHGSLEDLDGLRDGAAASDGVIHLAFNNDFAFDSDISYQDVSDMDRRAIEAMGGALAGSDGPLVVPSGTALLTPGRLGTEDDPADPASPGGPRVPSEEAALSMAERGVRASVVRLAPSVHGEGDRGFVPGFIATAREKCVSAYVGDGSNRWPAVHRLDAAHLFRLALETAPAGARLHGVGGEGVPFRDIAEVIGRHLDMPVVTIPPEEVDDHFGLFSPFVSMDNPTSSALTRERMGWQPTHPGLIEDLEQGHYFRTPAA